MVLYCTVLHSVLVRFDSLDRLDSTRLVVLENVAVALLPKVDGVGGLSSYGGNLAIQSLVVALMTYIITISIGKTFQRINDNAYKINGGQVSACLHACLHAC